MKILMIAPEPFFSPRGTPISVYQRLWGLSQLGHEVVLLTYHLGEDVDIPGVKVVRIPKIRFIRTVPPGPSLRKLFLDLILLLHAVRLLFTHRFDALHTHEEASFFSLLMAPSWYGVHVYDRHSALSEQLNAGSRLARSLRITGLFRFLERRVLNKCSAVITIGPDLFGETKEKYPELPSTLIENLPLQETFSAPTDQCVQELHDFLCNGCRGTVVYTGTLETYQRMDLLVEAAKQVVRRYPQVRFLIAGGTVQQVHHWEQVVTQERLDSSFRFLGSISVPEVLALLDVATILVSPRASGMSVPLKIYTYMGAGKPILATRINGHTDVLTDDSAYLVAPTSTALADGLIRLLGDPDLRTRLGQRAKQLGSEINSAETYLNKLNVIYGNLREPLEETSTTSARVWGR